MINKNELLIMDFENETMINFRLCLEELEDFAKVYKDFVEGSEVEFNTLSKLVEIANDNF